MKLKEKYLNLKKKPLHVNNVFMLSQSNLTDPESSNNISYTHAIII